MTAGIRTITGAITITETIAGHGSRKEATMGLDEHHEGRDTASGFDRGVVAFEERTREAISLRLAGYSEEQVEKLLARGRDLDEVVEGRRAA